MGEHEDKGITGGLDRRRVLIAGAAAVTATAAPDWLLPTARAATAREWVGAGAFQHLYDPTPGVTRGRYINDHCFIRGKDGRWHLYGITGDSAVPGQFPDGNKEIRFAHATAPSLSGPWTSTTDALVLDPQYFSEEHLWAPHVVESGGTYYMFYSAGGTSGCAINLATSTDLYTWKRHAAGPLFRGIRARDTAVVRIGTQWVMYYCEVAAVGGAHIVSCRTSTNLVNWSAARTVFTDPSKESNSPSVTESPFVVQRGDWWYLFIGPRNGYTGTDVYASLDPMSFPLGNYAGHVPAHAAEVIQDAGAWWISSAGSFSRGVYLAPLRWQGSPPVWHGPRNPEVALDVTGRLQLFALDPSDRRILRRAQTHPATNAWGEWEVFGEPAAAVPSVARNLDGRLEVFAINADTTLSRRIQRADGTWDAWASFGGAAGAAPVVGRNLDGRLEVFVLGPGGAYITHRWQNRANAAASDWSAWEQFGGAAGALPVVGTHADGRLEVFVPGPANACLAHRWQNTPNGSWSAWDTTLGGPLGTTPTLARDPRGILELFSLAPVGVGVHMLPQTKPSGGWGSWSQFASWADSPPTVVASKDGRLESFHVLPGGTQLAHRWQNNTTDGVWHAPEVFADGPIASAPSAILDAGGLLHVFLVAPDGSLRERVQVAPSGGFGNWQAFGTRRIAAVPCGSPT
ncbi:family 43 glycosylhydrolase [Archangium primigenium]|uniref:family 43 glycosylhydrolase n=1 Tax=[Archangium] primigenium TaxID=2792470 RepID=UPI00195C4242|nr:family 43 glycosylhydrolase [Archangium primigenium]MBM7114892.1 family 43 glycosylhydrolase [Archangium primigenium]